MSHKVFLGLGSNLGDRVGYLNSALEKLQPDAQVSRRSPIYETEPWGYTDQPKFLNMVAEVETDLPPIDLLKRLKEIEKEIGREPTFTNGPRVIDLDILLYDDLILDEGRLHIPHPNLRERAFVLVPLADLEPQLLIPGSQNSVGNLLEKVDTTGIEKFDEEETQPNDTK